MDSENVKVFIDNICLVAIILDILFVTYLVLKENTPVINIYSIALYVFLVFPIAWFTLGYFLS